MHKQIMLQKTLSLLLVVAFMTAFTTPALGKNKTGTPKDNAKISVVVIDPGHGGKDFGASIGSAKEKDIVLNIALKLGKIIQKNHPDVEVVYTRTKDVLIPLNKRAEIANHKEADLFISIHVNAVAANIVSGTETFVLGLHSNTENLKVAQKENAAILLENNYHTEYEDFDPNSDESYIMFSSMQEEFQNQSILMASYIQEELRAYAKRIDRSVKMAGFLVLRKTTMPSVLIETGFISHPEERNFLLSDKGQNTIAKSISRAFTNYKIKIEERSEFNVINEDTTPLQKKSMQEEKQSTSTTEKYSNAIISAETDLKQKADTTTFKTKPASIKTSGNIYFSIQVMALKRRIDASAKNFKGEKNMFRVDYPDISRYFSGKFNSLEEAKAEKERIAQKYENAFVVAFKNKALISVKKALETR